jgi:FixJ family two-component response regulator
MPGKELLAQLRQRDATVPVVFLVDKVVAGDNDQCGMVFDQGGIDFIVKSRDRQVFVRRLRRLVEFANSKMEVAG